MYFHPFTAPRAGDDPFQLAPVQRFGNCIRSPESRPPVAHNGRERLPRQQDAIAQAAVLNPVLIHQSLPQRDTALGTVMLPGAPECEDAIRVVRGVRQGVLSSAVSAAQPAMQHAAIEWTAAILTGERWSGCRPH